MDLLFHSLQEKADHTGTMATRWHGVRRSYSLCKQARWSGSLTGNERHGARFRPEQIGSDASQSPVFTQPPLLSRLSQISTDRIMRTDLYRKKVFAQANETLCRSGCSKSSRPVIKTFRFYFLGSKVSDVDAQSGLCFVRIDCCISGKWVILRNMFVIL